MGGRITMESVVRCSWNGWPDDRGIRSLWAGRKEASAANRPTTPPRTEARPEPTAPPASRETALAHIANIRKMLNAPTNAGDIAAQAMQARGWQPHPA
ncbi:hypothetical protein GG670_30930 [Pseudomonas aeruginosa]|nr:hypothetical protein [Pseudomonas aeruginosa]